MSIKEVWRNLWVRKISKPFNSQSRSCARSFWTEILCCCFWSDILTQFCLGLWGFSFLSFFFCLMSPPLLWIGSFLWAFGSGSSSSFPATSSVSASSATSSTTSPKEPPSEALYVKELLGLIVELIITCWEETLCDSLLFRINLSDNLESLFEHNTYSMVYFLKNYVVWMNDESPSLQQGLGEDLW